MNDNEPRRIVIVGAGNTLGGLGIEKLRQAIEVELAARGQHGEVLLVTEEEAREQNLLADYELAVPDLPRPPLFFPEAEPRSRTGKGERKRNRKDRW